MLSGQDVVGIAQTGTGKTAAFALPSLASLDFDSGDTANIGAMPYSRTVNASG
jgi:superfamily II DNA/RNA helicase